MRAAWPKQPVAPPRPTESGWPGPCRSRGLADEAAKGGLGRGSQGGAWPRQPLGLAEAVRGWGLGRGRGLAEAAIGRGNSTVRETTASKR